MLTRLKLKRGEETLVESLEVGSRRRSASFPHSPPPVLPQVAVEASVSMSHEGEPRNTIEDEKVFRKAFFDMTKMVNVLYEERNTRLQGESSKPTKGEGSPGGGSNGNGGKPTPSPPPSYSSSTSQASSSSSTNTTLTHTHQHTSIGIGTSPLLKLDVKFELPMYNVEVNAEKLDNWVC